MILRSRIWRLPDYLEQISQLQGLVGDKKQKLLAMTHGESMIVDRSLTDSQNVQVSARAAPLTHNRLVLPNHVLLSSRLRSYTPTMTPRGWPFTITWRAGVVQMYITVT